MSTPGPSDRPAPPTRCPRHPAISASRFGIAQGPRPLLRTSVRPDLGTGTGRVLLCPPEEQSGARRDGAALCRAPEPRALRAATRTGVVRASNARCSYSSSGRVSMSEPRSRAPAPRWAETRGHRDAPRGLRRTGPPATGVRGSGASDPGATTAPDAGNVRATHGSSAATEGPPTRGGTAVPGRAPGVGVRASGPRARFPGVGAGTGPRKPGLGVRASARARSGAVRGFRVPGGLRSGGSGPADRPPAGTSGRGPDVWTSGSGVLVPVRYAVAVSAPAVRPPVRCFRVRGRRLGLRAAGGCARETVRGVCGGRGRPPWPRNGVRRRVRVSED